MKQRFAAVFFCIVCIACGAGAKVLDTLIVQGLIINQQSVVRNSINLWEKAEFTSADVQTAIKALYKTGLFKTVDFYTTRETDSAVSLMVKVVENPNIEAIEFSGNKKFSKKECEEKLTLKKGLPLSDAALNKNCVDLKKMYAAKGYLLAVISPEVLPTKIPGNVIVKIKIDEGPKLMVKKVSFTGNVDIKEGKLKSNFKTKEKQWFWGGDFDADEYKADLDSLVLYYNDLGYIDARIVRDSIWYGDTKKDIYISIDVSEGRKFVTGDFFFTGNKVIETSDLNASVLMKKGKPFIKSDFEKTKENVTTAYREEGYLWVQVKDHQSYRGDTVDVTFDITEGRPALVRKVDIIGNVKTLENVVRREMRLYPGDKYKQSLMMRSVRDIYQLNFFSNVKPDLHPNEDGTVDLVFTIAEKENIGQLSLGASYSELDKVMGTFTTSIPNFRGTGQQLDLNFQYGQYSKNATIGFMEPWAFNSPTRLSGNIFYTDYHYTYNYSNYGFRGSVTRRLKWPDDFFLATVGYEISYKQDYSNDTSYFPQSKIQLTPRGVYSGLTLTLERNDLDMPMFPTQGTLLSISPEIAGLGGKYSFMKTIMEYDSYFPLPEKFVLAAKTKFSCLTPMDNSGEMRISRWDALTLGGSWPQYGNTPLRGYTDRSIGGVTGHEGDGVALMYLSSELSYPILEQTLYLSVFGEMGNAWSHISDVDLSDMYPSAGFSASINVPMLGLIGFDLGYGFKDPLFKGSQTDYTETHSHKWEFGFRMGRSF